MKSIQIVGPNRIEMREVDVPAIASPTDVLIQVKAVGLCGSDVHLIHGSMQVSSFPRVVGHEVSGVVSAVGSGVTRFAVGDRVLLEPIRYCGKCHACRRGHPNVCRELRVTAVHMDGGFQEYTLADEKQLYKIPEGVTFEQAAMVEPYTIAMQANWRGGTQEGDFVLVHGAGPIGLTIIEVAKELGAKVIVSEPAETRRAGAVEFGADYCVNPLEESLAERVAEITGGMGPNVIFECAGIPSLMSLSMELAANAGSIVSLGFDSRTTAVPFSTITRKELNIVGSRLEAYKFEEAIAKLPARLPYINKLIKHVLPFEEYEKAIDLFMDKEQGSGKIVLKW